MEGVALKMQKEEKTAVMRNLRSLPRRVSVNERALFLIAQKKMFSDTMSQRRVRRNSERKPEKARESQQGRVLILQKRGESTPNWVQMDIDPGCSTVTKLQQHFKFV